MNDEIELIQKLTNSMKEKYKEEAQKKKNTELNHRDLKKELNQNNVYYNFFACNIYLRKLKKD